MAYCENDWCERETIRNRRYCERCAKRVQRGGTKALAAPPMEKKTPWQAVVDQAIYMVDEGLSDDDAVNDQNEQTLKRKIENWMRSRGWTPPGQSRAGISLSHARRRSPPAARPPPARADQLDLPLNLDR